MAGSHERWHSGSGQCSGLWQFQSHFGSAQTDSQTGGGQVTLHEGELQTALHCGQLCEQVLGGQITVQSGSSQVSKHPSIATGGQRVSHFGALQMGSQTSSHGWDVQDQVQTGWHAATSATDRGGVTASPAGSPGGRVWSRNCSNDVHSSAAHARRTGSIAKVQSKNIGMISGISFLSQ